MASIEVRWCCSMQCLVAQLYDSTVLHHILRCSQSLHFRVLLTLHDGYCCLAERLMYSSGKARYRYSSQEQLRHAIHTSLVRVWLVAHVISSEATAPEEANM